MKKSLLKLVIGLGIVGTVGLFAENVRPANIPQDWPEECIPKICKEQSTRNCASYTASSPCHKINQSFGGSPFIKDTSIWDVTPEFGKKYGMEEEYIDPELHGIEAVSYRLKNGFLECGFGGKADSCMQQTEGVLEIYVDETKTPLPWLHPYEMADWHANYSSARLLRTTAERDDHPYPSSEQIVINKLTKGSYKIRPFADPQTNHEAAYFEDVYISTGEKWKKMIGGILGYKRHAIDGLTVISFFYQASSDNYFRKDKGKEVNLVSDFDQIYGPLANNAKTFHSFYIPAEFIKKIEETDNAYKEKNNAFFKQVFEQMKNK